MNVKKLVLGIGIFIVYLLMLNYGIEAFYSSPKYEDFCGSFYEYAYPSKDRVGDNSCIFNKTLSEQINICNFNGGFVVYEYDETGCPLSIKECNFCNKEFNESQKEYFKMVFVISIIVGIITLFFGFFYSVEPVSSSFMASGIGAIFYGSSRNWENLSDIWRFLLLLSALILLIWISLRLNRKRKN